MKIWSVIVAVMTVLSLGLLYLVYRAGGWLPVAEVLAVSTGVTAWGIYREKRGK